MRRWVVVVAIVVLGMAGLAAAQTPGRGRATAPGQQKTTPAVADAKPSPGAGPIVVFETVKGTFEMETYPNEAPKSVEHRQKILVSVLS